MDGYTLMMWSFTICTLIAYYEYYDGEVKENEKDTQHEMGKMSKLVRFLNENRLSPPNSSR
jgi:hypothetical protein